MAIEKVKEYFKQFGLQDRIMEFKNSSETVALAAQAVGCEEKQITKTMSFMVNDKPILIAMAGDARISNPKYKQVFLTKARMLTYEEVDELIGHSVGGVCPFAINDGVDVYLDISLKRLDYLYPAAGSGNSAVKLTVEELEKHSNSKGWIDVCKDWEQIFDNR